MTATEVRDKADQLRAERLNATGKAAIDTWEMLMLEAINASGSQMATICKAAEGQLRAAFASDKLKDAENIDRLLALQEAKNKASARARGLTVLDGGG